MARVDDLRKRLGKGALEAEKVAYVLGKREESLGETASSAQAGGVPSPVQEREKEGKHSNKPTNAKRKPTETDSVDDKTLESQTAKRSKAAASSNSSNAQRATRSSTRNKGEAS